MARNSKAAQAAAGEKKLTIPQAINLYNDAAAKAKDATRDVNACKPILKDWGQQYGNQISETEMRAERVVDGYTCVVHLGLSIGFEADAAAVIKAFGLDTCLAEGLLSVNLAPLRKLAAVRQVPLARLGEDKAPTISIGKCEAVKARKARAG